jgi:hypothetical protein
MAEVISIDIDPERHFITSQHATIQHMYQSENGASYAGEHSDINMYMTRENLATIAEGGGRFFMNDEIAETGLIGIETGEGQIIYLQQEHVAIPGMYEKLPGQDWDILLATPQGESFLDEQLQRLQDNAEIMDQSGFKARKIEERINNNASESAVDSEVRDLDIHEITTKDDYKAELLGAQPASEPVVEGSGAEFTIEKASRSTFDVTDSSGVVYERCGSTRRVHAVSYDSR